MAFTDTPTGSRGSEHPTNVVGRLGERSRQLHMNLPQTEVRAGINRCWEQPRVKPVQIIIERQPNHPDYCLVDLCIILDGYENVSCYGSY